MSWAGVDGCRAGWLVALLDEHLPRLELCPDFAAVAELTADCQAVAVDMPIGLPGDGQVRLCEQIARRMLGPRRSSVFTTPPRRYLEARQFEQVRQMSLQSFHLLPKIREVDAWMTPERQQRVWEAHPELVFQRLAGRPLEHAKKTPEGRRIRQQLLPWPAPASRWRVKEVQGDDILDALAMLWCAQHPYRILSPQQRDPRALLMELYG